MAQIPGIAPVLRVVPGGELSRQIEARDAASYQAGVDFQRGADEFASKAYIPGQTGLVNYILKQYEIFRNHRNTGNSGWANRLLEAQRTFNGIYDPSRLAAIRRFGGSEVYARIIAMKCRGASSLLRDVYLSPDKPWAIRPPADPDVPLAIIQAVQSLVSQEVQSFMAQGLPPPDAGMIRDRTMQLMAAARQSAKKQADRRAEVIEDRIEEILTDGGFYNALAEFIVDLPQFPYACIKGPVVKIVPAVSWELSNAPIGNQLPSGVAPQQQAIGASGSMPAGPTPLTPGIGQPAATQNSPAQVKQEPRLTWQRVSPFDLYWSPGASDIESADVIERTRLTRAEINDLLDLPGYNTDAVRAVLDDYGRGGLADNWDSTDSERAVNESRENPLFNQSGIINCLEFHGNVQGRLLLDADFGFTDAEVPDPLRDYFIQAWLIGRYVIKAQLSPSPRKRHPYYITSFEKIPGTPVGNGLPDILADVQEVANATLRSLVNNLSIASGPQAVINVDRIAPGTNAEDMYPWKRWFMTADPMGNQSQPPISFFQPNSNAQELLAVYQAFSAIADDLSAIPRYLAGQGAPGGAGRTAAGLSMLMSNASKVLQTVSANIDRDVMTGALTGLYDMLMLTDTTGLLQGDETIKVMGVNVAIQRETQRARQLEFLSITANPLDAQIMGAKGRAAVLREVSKTIGMDGEEIVPSEDQINKMQQAQEAAPPPPPPGQEEQMKAGQGGPPQGGAPALAAKAQGGKRPMPGTNDMGPRENLTPNRAGGPRVGGGVQ